MNTPSARPPSSRRFDSLDTEAARRFSSRGVNGEWQGASISVPAAPPAAAEASDTSPAPRREAMKVLTVRLPESLHARLDFIARNSPHSMNSFVQAALEPAVAAEIEKINKRKAMGLD
jgi:hypothetical protein